MKCTQMADWLEEFGEGAVNRDWETQLGHARGCPDCSLFLRQRGELLETLKELPVPAVPPELQASILSNLDLSEEEPARPGWQDLLMPLLTPVQVVLAGMCLFVAMNVVYAPVPPRSEAALERLRLASHQPVVMKAPMPVVPRPGESLVRLSDHEVRDFRRKLDEYRRMHPEMENTAPVPVELAGFRGR